MTNRGLSGTTRTSHSHFRFVASSARSGALLLIAISCDGDTTTWANPDAAAGQGGQPSDADPRHRRSRQAGEAGRGPHEMHSSGGSTEHSGGATGDDSDGGQAASNGGAPANPGGNAGSGSSAGSGGRSGSGGENPWWPLTSCLTYIDRTAHDSARTIAWNFDLPEEKCMRVRTGQSVTWLGDFSVHPIIPFATPENVIVPSEREQDMHTVVFDSAGTFGYICTAHTEMRGAIEVVP